MGQPTSVREELARATKSYDLSKQEVFEAWKCVKANGGAAGLDRESIEQFEQNLAGNLYKIWNRMASGSYHPPPVRTVEIPKRSGGVRPLGIPTVADRVAQTVVKRRLEPSLERHFDPDSYGYRPGKSAHDAIQVTRARCWTYAWVVEFDIKGAFDHLDHGLLLKALSRHTDCKWVLLYIKRWLTAPAMKEGQLQVRDRGTPQGGVVSPLLMNLFMHYAFDRWMRRMYRHCPFARYADDGVIHCRSEAEAQQVKAQVAERFLACGLELHPEKTRIVFCRDSNRQGSYPTIQFTFLGFTFRPRKAVNRQGEVFTSFLPAVSREAQQRMRQRIHSWHLPRQTPGTLEEFSSKYDAVMAGWWNYFGRFYPAELHRVFQHFDLTLAFWARRKYRELSGRRRGSREWLKRVAQRRSDLFGHWRRARAPRRMMGAV